MTEAELTDKLDNCLTQILVFLKDKAMAMPNFNSEIKHTYICSNERFAIGRRRVDFVIHRYHNNTALVSILAYKGESRYNEHRVSIGGSTTAEDIKLEVQMIEFENDLKQKIICAWKLDGLKGDILSKIQEASDNAQAALDRQAVEKQLIENFEV